MYKKILSVLLILVMLFSSSVVFAGIGDVDADHGGGSTGIAGPGDGYNDGQDGLRITIVNAISGMAVSKSVDFANASAFFFYDGTPFTVDIYGDGYKSKIDYVKKSATFKPTFATGKPYEYKTLTTTNPLPQVIGTGGDEVSMDKIIEYMRDESVINFIATTLNFPYDKLVSGDYVLMIEPVSYFKYSYKVFALTATECALFDQKNPECLRRMGNLTRKNAPLALFLRKSGIYFPVWKGSKTERASISDCISALGVCIINYGDIPDTGGSAGTPTSKDYVYRCDTDVITSVLVSAPNKDVTTEDGGSVTFNILGKTYSSNYVLPEGEEELVWVRWHTPKTPCEFDVKVNVTGGGKLRTSKLGVAVQKLDEKTPPDPTGRDTNSGFYLKPTRTFGDKYTHTWCEWTTEKITVSDKWINTGRIEKDPITGIEKEVWVHEIKYDWEYTPHYYTARFDIKPSLVPDPHCPTAKKSAVDNRLWQIRSAYGIQVNMPYTVSNGGYRSAVTDCQNAVAFFPEFDFTTYNRVMVNKGGKFTFANNPYSQWESATHFTPIWYPDGAYKVAVTAFDVWTPVGQLYADDEVQCVIKGNVYDDWHSAIRFLTNITL